MSENPDPVPADDVSAAEEPGAAPPADTEGTPDTAPPREEDTFPIFGIGASAGGLEALDEFLASVPPTIAADANGNGCRVRHLGH